MPGPLISDTHPDIERLQIELMRQAPTWKKAHMVDQMFQTSKHLARIGLCKRHPQASQAELHRRLADLILGPELAMQVFGAIGAKPENDVT